MIDSFSFAVGVIITLVVVAVFMVLLLFWVSCRSYELGWRDHKENKWIGNKEDSKSSSFFSLLNTINRKS